MVKLIGYFRLQELDFKKGWENTTGRVLQTLRLILDFLEALDPNTLEKFVARIPMVFVVVIISPHGYFGQVGVLGLPDTGGQVRISHRSLLWPVLCFWCFTPRFESGIIPLCYVELLSLCS